jgi:uncharacterized protein YaaR (DUF327 family)
MEELWKKFKEDTREDLLMIKDFLESFEKSKNNRLTKSSPNETSKKIYHKRQEIYGKMRNLVKEIMEKENISRAQAYRRAKMKFLNETSLG